LLISCLCAGFAHAFTHAALVQKILFEPFELAVEQIICLVDEANYDICHYFCGAGIGKAYNFRGILQRIAQVTNVLRFVGIFFP
jgi:hypothetical protein